MERRRRSNALHAETQEEYLEKLEQIESRVCHTPPHRAHSLDDKFGGFDFQIDIDPEPPAEEDQQTSQKYHRILVMSDDLGVSHQKINELLEHVCSNEGLSESTQDEMKPYLGDCQDVLPFDIYIMKRIVKTTQHLFQFNIQNSTSHEKLALFEETYYRGFEAFVHIKTEQPSGVSQVKAKLQAGNPKVKFFTLSRDCEYCFTPMKKIKIEDNTSFSTGFLCGSFVEVVDQLLK